jgi:4-amino-4-deoxy-L-arabinose transferase-like glycosyltransferase
VSLSPLTWDENYYWVWSQNLQLSYYDHPAMVAWLFAIGNFLPTFMLKWPAIILGHSFLLIWDRFLLNINFSQSQRMVFFILALFSPVVGLSTLVLTPDLPLLFFLSLSVYAFERALTLKTHIWYGFFGLFMGLGFTSKYHIVLIIPGILIYLFADKKWSEISWSGLLLTLLAFTIGASPVLIWNAQNNWISFKFQMEHGVGTHKYKNIWPIEFILSQILILTPLFINDFFKKKPVTQWSQFFLIVFSPILIFFIVNSFKHKVEANWTQIAFPFILSYLATKSLSQTKLRLYSAFWFTLVIVLLSQWKFNWWKNPPSERLTEPSRYQELNKELNKEPDKYQPLYASSYQMASYLWFQNKKPVYKIYATSRMDFFDYFPQAKPTESLFYVAKTKDTEFPDWFRKLRYNTSLTKTIDENLEIIRVTK